MTVICAHCGRPQRGLAGIQIQRTYYPLCHPDQGVDCYTLVTVHHHDPYECAKCALAPYLGEDPCPPPPL